MRRVRATTTTSQRGLTVDEVDRAYGYDSPGLERGRAMAVAFAPAVNTSTRAPQDRRHHRLRLLQITTTE
jgi:hypothetical protein